MNFTIKQYEMLREEIMNNEKAIQNLLTVTYIATGAILAYGIANFDVIVDYFELPMLFIPIFVIYLQYSLD